MPQHGDIFLLKKQDIHGTFHSSAQFQSEEAQGGNTEVVQHEAVKPLLEVGQTHPFEMRVLVYRTSPRGQEPDMVGIWLEQVRGANKQAILSVLKSWFAAWQEPCVLIKHEEDGSEQQLFAYPPPPRNQSYESYCRQLRIEDIERRVAAEIERQRIEEEEEDDLDDEDTLDEREEE